MINSLNKQFYLHRSSTIDNQLFSICLPSCKQWKNLKTANKWLDTCKIKENISIVEIIYDEKYHYPKGVKQ